MLRPIRQWHYPSPSHRHDLDGDGVERELPNWRNPPVWVKLRL